MLANGENMDEENGREQKIVREEEDKLESSQKCERIGSHDSATTTTRDVQEESEKRSQTGRAHGMEGENERRKRGGGGEEMKGGVFRHFNTFTKSISHDVNMRSLLINVLLGDKWVIHFDGIPSIRFQLTSTWKIFVPGNDGPQRAVRIFQSGFKRGGVQRLNLDEDTERNIFAPSRRIRRRKRKKRGLPKNFFRFFLRGKRKMLQ